jgi:hypothetical protein
MGGKKTLTGCSLGEKNEAFTHKVFFLQNHRTSPHSVCLGEYEEERGLKSLDANYPMTLSALLTWHSYS